MSRYAGFAEILRKVRSFFSSTPFRAPRQGRQDTDCQPPRSPPQPHGALMPRLRRLLAPIRQENEQIGSPNDTIIVEVGHTGVAVITGTPVAEEYEEIRHTNRAISV